MTRGLGPAGMSSKKKVDKFNSISAEERIMNDLNLKEGRMARDRHPSRKKL